MRSIFILILIIVSIAPTLLKPHVGVLVWTWISYMNPHRLSWGFITNFPMLDIVAGSTILATLVAKEKLTLRWHPILIAIGIFTLWVCLTSLLAEDPHLVWPRFDRFYKSMLFAFVAILLLNKRTRLDAFIYVLVLSIGYFGIKGGVFTILTGGNFIVSGPPKSSIGDRNELAVALVMILPLLFYLYAHGRHVLIRWSGLLGIPLFATAVLGSQSRGGLIALLAMTLVLVMRSKRRIPLLVLVAAASIVILTFMPESWWTRMESITNYQTDASAMGRIKIWGFAWRVAMDHPIFGSGLGTFVNREFAAHFIEVGERLRASHSIYFEVLAEHGFVGLFTYFLMGATAFLTCHKIIRISKGAAELAWAKDLAVALQASIIGFAVGGAFLALSLFDLYFDLIALTMIVHIMVERQLARAPKENVAIAAGPGLAVAREVDFRAS